MAVFNVAQYLSCIPSDGTDPETGCRACGENARTEYEQCRQTYFLKKQSENTKIISDTQSNILNSSNNNSAAEIQNLQKENSQLKLQILEQRNINSSLQQNQKQYENSISLLIYGVVVSFVFGIALAYLIFKKKKPNYTSWALPN